MIVVKIIVIAIIGSICSILLKQIKPEISVFILIATGLIILLEAFGYLSSIIEYFTSIQDLAGIDNNLLKIILKIIGIGYLVEFATALCNDCCLTSIATKIQFAGKVIILFVSLPVITTLIEIIMSLLKLC